MLTSFDIFEWYHLYNIQFESDKLGVRKDALLRPLVEEYGVQCWIQYVPVYLFSILREQGHEVGECSVAEDIFRKKLISLPISPTMTKDQAQYTTKSIKAIIDRLKSERE